MTHLIWGFACLLISDVCVKGPVRQRGGGERRCHDGACNGISMGPSPGGWREEPYWSQRAVIALSWPAGTRVDGTATLVNITSRRLNVPNTTSALHRIKLKSKLKCFFFFFLYPLQYYWPGANTFPGFISHRPRLCLLWVLNRLWTLSPSRAKLVF